MPPMYAIRPSATPTDSRPTHPYKFYKSDFFAVLQPKNEGATGHRYDAEQTAKLLLECFGKGHKVFILKEEAPIPGEASEEIKNKDSIEDHLEWKEALLQVLNDKAPHASHQITAHEVYFVGTPSSRAKREVYNEIQQIPHIAKTQ